MKPTKVQEREFWEWCGFKEWVIPGWWVYPNKPSYEHNLIPPIDLNNLFKYAAPKLECVCLKTNLGISFIAEVQYGGTVYMGNFTDPALALFWAIYEIIKEMK